ncbi:hypothetical protein AeRB84_000620 [Aphanomyces euteiches]|nr:hypothetical protein AeRB84_000620 [Aphanomyces euteiches]
MKTIDTSKKMKIFTGSWNVGNKMPPTNREGISAWIPEGGGVYDILAIGVQESTYKKKASHSNGNHEMETVPEQEHEEDDDDDDAAQDIEMQEVVLEEPPKPKTPTRMLSLTKHNSATASTYPFFVQLQEHLGSHYHMAGSVELMEIRLVVFVHTQHHVSDVEKITEATGVGNVIGNKGGVVLKLHVNTRSFCFVNCHLAAHEAQKFLERRNNDVAEILNGARLGQKSIELDHQFDHAFWFGDMNYRVNLGYSDPKEMSKEEHWAAVHSLVAAKEYNKLYENDQLQHQMHANKVLAGWTTSPCNFPPTFKRLRGKTDEYTKQRVPSYCDRVLWKSLPGFEKHLKLIEYKCVQDICTSDHKPIFASFELEPLPPASPDFNNHDMVEVKLTNLSAANLAAMDMNGQSDPYIKFYCSVPGMLLSDETKRPQTAVLKSTLNPSWDDIQIPALQLKCPLSQLQNVHLIMLLMDWDATSADDPLGQAVLYLPDYYAPEQSLPFEVPVIRNGIHSGTIRGQVSVAPSGKKFAEWEKNHTRVPGCTCSTM